MKIKIIALILLVFFICSIFWYYRYVYGWMEFKKNTDTPSAFLNYNKNEKETYFKDSVKILSILRGFIVNHEQSFRSKEYFDSTKLIIDTIIYDSNFNKLSVFVISQNPTYRQLAPNEKHQWYYDGYCYFGIKENDTVDLNYIDGGFANFYDESEISSTLRSFYFRRFAAIKDASGVSEYKYNLNDKRFWYGPIWGKIEEKELRRKAFEIEKKNHPENVYEPKN